MAAATAKEKTVTTTTLEGVTLDLTPEEADALLAVIANVGGSSERSRRGAIEGIRDAIRSACPEFFGKIYCLSPAHAEASGAIYFDDFTR